MKTEDNLVTEMSFWLVQNPSSYLSFQLVWNLSWMPDKSERLRTSRNDPTSGNDNPETFLMNSLVSSCLYSPPLVKGGGKGGFYEDEGKGKIIHEISPSLCQR